MLLPKILLAQGHKLIQMARFMKVSLLMESNQEKVNIHTLMVMFIMANLMVI